MHLTSNGRVALQSWMTHRSIFKGGPRFGFKCIAHPPPADSALKPHRRLALERNLQFANSF